MFASRKVSRGEGWIIRHHLSATLLDGLETDGPGCYDAVAIARAAGFRMLVMSRLRYAAIVPQPLGAGQKSGQNIADRSSPRISSRKHGGVSRVASRCARLRAATKSTTARFHGWDRHGALLAFRAARVEDELFAFTSGGVIVPSPNRCDRPMRLVVSNGKHNRKTDDA